MITRAWTDATADGEIWIYPVADCNGVYLEIRAVSDGKAITWSVSPSEAGVLVSLLKDVAAEDDPAEKSIPANPPASTQEPSEPEKDEDPSWMSSCLSRARKPLERDCQVLEPRSQTHSPN